MVLKHFKLKDYEIQRKQTVIHMHGLLEWNPLIYQYKA